jgi:hypothetical protein
MILHNRLHGTSSAYYFIFIALIIRQEWTIEPCCVSVGENARTKSGYAG